MSTKDSKPEQPCTLQSVIGRILLMIAMACVVVIVGEITPDKYDVSVIFVIGWWCSLIYGKLFP